MFIIVNGYNEDKQLFYYLDGRSESYQELPFGELGRNHSPYWFYQIYEVQLEIDVLQGIKESFLQAVFKAETHDLMLPESDYACGLKAYDAIVEALRSGDYDAAGAYEILFTYSAAKKDAARYAQVALTYWPALKKVAEHYTRLSGLYEEIMRTELHTKPLPASQLNDLIDLFHAAKATETAAIQSIRTLLREPISNRFHDIGLR